MKIEFDDNNLRAAEVFGRALLELVGETPRPQIPGDLAPEMTESDPKGVAFNAEFCGAGKDPFYTSGPREGQWKKRRGVNDADYDAWYASMLPAQEEPPSLFAPAFTPAPTNLGQLMGLIAQATADEKITREQSHKIWEKAGVSQADCFAPKSADEIANSVGKVYAQLKAIL